MKRALLLLLCLLAAAAFAALGVWQIQRRAWKLDLIARVDARIHAPAVAVPSPGRWASVTAQSDEYRRVRLAGHFLHDRATLVDALTERGPGFWVMTPMVTRQGTVLVNRGFVPPEHRRDFTRPRGELVVTGLLRMSEPGGRFLRPNRPGADLWYARDVAAIAAARHLGPVAPFFVDAEGGSGYPVGGLTVVQFRNMHLVYALTWFSLAAMAGFGAWSLYRSRS